MSEAKAKNNSKNEPPKKLTEIEILEFHATNLTTRIEEMRNSIRELIIMRRAFSEQIKTLERKAK